MREEAACIANIGPQGRRQRRQMGIRWLAISGGASAALLLTRLPRWLRLGVFGPFALGAVGIFQSYEQTCVALAAAQMRDMDAGAEQIDDALANRQITRQARKVIAESLLVAALLTALLWLLPQRRAD